MITTHSLLRIVRQLLEEEEKQKPQRKETVIDVSRHHKTTNDDIIHTKITLMKQLADIETQETKNKLLVRKQIIS